MRDAFLQQQQGRLELGISHETVLHRLLSQQMDQRQESHALVMGHEGTHHHVILPGRHAGGRVIDGLIEAELTTEAGGIQALQVLAGCFRRHHQRHHAGVRRNHQVLAQAALQTQAGHTEGAVLVVHARVHGVVAGLGDAPRNVVKRAVCNLRFHGVLRCLVQQRVRVARHHQLRHQVLEHRAAPRQQRRIAVDLGQQASECEPGFLRQLALGNGDETAQARFGGEQVIEATVQAMLVQVVADGQQMARTVIEEFIVHQRELSGPMRQLFELKDAYAGTVRRRRACGSLQHLAQRGNVFVLYRSAGRAGRVRRRQRGNEEPQFHQRGLAGIEQRRWPMQRVYVLPQGRGPCSCDLPCLRRQLAQRALRITHRDRRMRQCRHERAAEIVQRLQQYGVVQAHRQA
ncbi:hypothetical protein D3C71_1133510 [compost metagenome]